ncbi:MAG: Clp protease ClpP [Clostridia bacterium]|nr:Clp protease ClpP [Clostridia bacterium]
MKFDIKNLSEEKAQLFFYGDICGSEIDAWSMDDQFPSAVKDFLKDYEGKEIEIHVNSGGGSCFAGICIGEMIKQHKGKVVAIVDGLSASIATLICCSADEVHINPNSYWMMHNSWCTAMGNKKDLLETAELLEKMDNTITDAYMKHVKEGISREQIVDMMNKETWLCGNEILDYFDFVLEKEEKVAYAKVDFNNYKNIPQSLLDELKEEKEDEEQEEETIEEVEDKCDDDKEKKNEAKELKCPQCDYVGIMEQDEDGFFICPECGVKFKLEEQDEPNTDDDMDDMEDGCKKKEEQDKCKEEEKAKAELEEAQAKAKLELAFLQAKSFLDNYK